MMRVKCLAHRKPSLSACCHSLPPLPGSCPLNSFSCCLSSASSSTPEKPSSQFRRGRIEGEETALLRACCAAGGFHWSVHGTPEPVCLSLPSLPSNLSQGLCTFTSFSLICSALSSHPLAPFSLLYSSSQRSPKSLSLEFQGPVLSAEWSFWAPLQL